MATGSMSTGTGIMSEAAKALRQRWEAIREEWADEAALRFEEEHLQVLWEQLERATQAAGKFGDAMNAARRAGSDPDRGL